MFGWQVSALFLLMFYAIIIRHMKNKKLHIILGAVISIAVLAAVLEKAHVIDIYNKKAAVTSQGPNEEQKKQESQSNADTKKEFIEGQGKEERTPSPASAPGKSIELTPKQETNNTVTVFTKLPGYSSGSCQLITTNGAKSNTQSANLIFQREFSTCAGFSVPIESLGKGTWTIRLNVTSNGTTENKVISYEVK